MEKINLKEVKKLSAILSGKVKPLSRFEEKLAKAKQQIILNDIKRDLVAARDMIKAADPNDPFTKEIFLFSFKGKFHQVEDSTHKVITEAEVKSLIDENADTKLYYLCTNEGMCPLPPAFIGKDAKAVQLKDDQAVIDYIKKLTSVEIGRNDL